MSIKKEKKNYQTPEMEVTILEEADVIVTSITVDLSLRSIKQSQVDNNISTAAHWDSANNPITTEND